MWVGDERELVMVLVYVLVLFLSLFMVLYLMCIYLILTFQVIMLSSCLGSK